MIKIQPIQNYQINETKQLILTVCAEIFQISPAEILHHDDLSDLDEVGRNYTNNRGIFLVAVENGRVIGCGGIRSLDAQKCELKRLFFLPDYRGQGLGLQIVKLLLNAAKTFGYREVLLDVVDEEKQASAIRFYQKLGFDFIERYNNCNIATVFMAKVL